MTEALEEWERNDDRRVIDALAAEEKLYPDLRLARLIGD